MKNSDKPINPSTSIKINDTEFFEYNIPHGERQYSGLTKREHYAGLAMQGLLANCNGGMTSGGSRTFSPNEISKLAVLHADELLKQLEEK